MIEKRIRRQKAKSKRSVPPFEKMRWWIPPPQSVLTGKNIHENVSHRIEEILKQ